MVLRSSLIVIAVCSLFARAASSEAQRFSTTSNESRLRPATLQELAMARKATAKYHDVSAAEADGYVDIGLYLPGEGYHWVKSSLIDGTFDPSQPEVLLYAPVSGENRLELVEAAPEGPDGVPDREFDARMNRI